jgi:agmatine deiminase
MPAEWEPHRATWLSWPHNRDTWPGISDFARIRDVWRQLAEALRHGERVEILAPTGEALDSAATMLDGVENVFLHAIATNDSWMRDHGPTFLAPADKNAVLPRAIINWGYNAWGGKYPPFDQDNLVPLRIAAALGIPKVFEPGIILEGGSIEVNGTGSVLVTEQCLLNPNRNPQCSKADIERYLADYLAAPHAIWLGDGIAGDDTDGHIDDMTRFVGPRTIVTAIEDDPSETNYEPLRENRRRLELARDEQGRPFEIVDLPMPRPIELDGQRLPASYANFYIGNRVVVVPIFHDPADERALAVLRALFPDREVVGIVSNELVDGLGAFHCITQQEPLVP